MEWLTVNLTRGSQKDSATWEFCTCIGCSPSEELRGFYLCASLSLEIKCQPLPHPSEIAGQWSYAMPIEVPRWHPDLRPPALGEINVCCLSCADCGILLQQPKLMKTVPFLRVTNWDGMRMTHAQPALPWLQGGLHWEERRPAEELRDGSTEGRRARARENVGCWIRPCLGPAPRVIPPPLCGCNWH